MPCQICFEDPRDDGLVTRYCSADCPAQVCRECLARHLTVSLDRYPVGVLPKLRCPICLKLVTLAQWEPRLGDLGNEAVTRYEQLCKRACGFRSPCCEKIDYTHLPEFDEALVQPDAKSEPEVESADKESAKADPALNALLDPEKSTEWSFPELCRAFCAFQTDARSVINAFTERFQPLEGDATATNKVFTVALRRIRDPERRAALLLSFLYKYPATRTRCCDRPVCFNCKRATDHTVCDQNENINESTCVVQCRQCRATLVKVEGCGSVSCLCGFGMYWDRELRYKLENQRGLIPVDIFDLEIMVVWETWRSRSSGCMHQLPAQAQAFAKRVEHRRLVGELIAKVGPQLQSLAQTFIYRLRSRKFLAGLERKLFWIAYHRAHPSEALDVHQERAELLCIEV